MTRVENIKVTDLTQDNFGGSVQEREETYLNRLYRLRRDQASGHSNHSDSRSTNHQKAENLF